MVHGSRKNLEPAMKHKAIIRPEAELDISEAFSWYDGLVSGLGSEFIERLDDAIDYILRNPEIHPIIYKNIRRAFIRRFPYAVYYIYEKSNIIVLAVFHFKRNPKSWLKRI
jgi:plasmid stabilization system protein ParE